jgi:hypothetical protein
LVPDVGLLTEPPALALDPRPVGDGQLHVEESIHVPNPLLLEVRGDDEQHAVGAVAGGQLLENEPRLDGLAEPHVVTDERALAELLHHPVDAGQLVGLQPDERVRDAE